MTVPVITCVLGQENSIILHRKCAFLAIPDEAGYSQFLPVPELKNNSSCTKTLCSGGEVWGGLMLFLIDSFLELVCVTACCDRLMFVMLSGFPRLL